MSIQSNATQDARYRSMSLADLNRRVAHLRNKRDAFAAGREPADVMVALGRALDELARRRSAR
jgi:hypothetical protein